MLCLGLGRFMYQQIQAEQKKLFEELGVFFAFSNKQFAEKKQDGVEYCTVMEAGDCVPKDKAPEFVRRWCEIQERGRKRLLEEKGIEWIIEYELANHESWYNSSIECAFEALAGFEVTREQVQQVFQDKAHKHCM